MSSHPPFFANAQVMALDPAEIFVPDRIGFYHEDKATALGRLIAVDGQRDPIKVQPRKGKQPWKLVTGLHRLRGCEMEGIQVYALEVQGKAEDLADLEASADRAREIHRCTSPGRAGSHRARAWQFEPPAVGSEGPVATGKRP